MSLKLRGCILNVPYDAFAVAVEVACFIIYSLINSSSSSSVDTSSWASFLLACCDACKRSFVVVRVRRGYSMEARN